MAHGSNVFFFLQFSDVVIISNQLKKRFSINFFLIEKIVEIWQKYYPKSFLTVSILCGEIFSENKFPQEFGKFFLFLNCKIVIE